MDTEIAGLEILEDPDTVMGEVQGYLGDLGQLEAARMVLRLTIDLPIVMENIVELNGADVDLGSLRVLAHARAFAAKTAGFYGDQFTASHLAATLSLATGDPENLASARTLMWDAVEVTEAEKSSAFPWWSSFGVAPFGGGLTAVDSPRCSTAPASPFGASSFGGILGAPMPQSRAVEVGTTEFGVAENQVVSSSDDRVIITDGKGEHSARDQLRAALEAKGLDHRAVSEIPFALDTSRVTDMNSMFEDCFGLVSVPEMDTSRVTDMSRMFLSCRSITSVPSMDTSQVTSMVSMFASCCSIVSIPEMDTSRVDSMSSMFFGCSSLVGVPAMDTSQARNMYQMFRGCRSLVRVPELDVSQVDNMANMFIDCSSIGELPEVFNSSFVNPGMFGPR